MGRALGGACAGACAASGFASPRGLRGLCVGLRGGVPSPLAPAAGEGRGGLRGGLRGRGCPARGGPRAQGAAPPAPCWSVRGGPRAGGAALRSLTRPDEETGHAGPAALRGGPCRTRLGLRGGPAAWGAAEWGRWAAAEWGLKMRPGTHRRDAEEYAASSRYITEFLLMILLLELERRDLLVFSCICDEAALLFICRMDDNSRFKLEIQIVAPNCRGRWYSLEKNCGC